MTKKKRMKRAIIKTPIGSIRLSFATFGIILLIFSLIDAIFGLTSISIAGVPLFVILAGLGAISYNGLPSLKSTMNIFVNSLPYVVLGLVVLIWYIQEYSMVIFQKTALSWMLGLFLFGTVLSQIVKNLIDKHEIA